VLVDVVPGVGLPLVPLVLLLLLPPLVLVDVVALLVLLWQHALPLLLFLSDLQHKFH
jgi:hypothetical protein